MTDPATPLSIDATSRLTPRQCEVLALVERVILDGGCFPTCAAIGRELGISRQGASLHLRALAAAGYVRPPPHPSTRYRFPQPHGTVAEIAPCPTCGLCVVEDRPHAHDASGHPAEPPVREP